MSHALTQEDGIDYPESDGKPMAETDRHAQEMVLLNRTLKRRYEHDPLAYVAMNNFIYYRKGDTSACFSPDGYVVFGVANQLRRTYKVWEEGGHVPSVVFEATSKSTKKEDLVDKKMLCAQLGVETYILYDPLAEYLRPALQGFRLNNQFYTKIEPEEDGSLPCATLGVHLFLDIARSLRLRDSKTGKLLLRDEEIAEEKDLARRKAESAKRRERKARRAAESARLDAEVGRLAAEAAREKEADARRAAHAARLDAEAAREKEADARRVAEAELAQLKAELAHLKSTSKKN